MERSNNAMDQLQHPLEFVHKFNLYKLSGLLIKDDDLSSIARVYGVSLEELTRVEGGFQRHIDKLAGELSAAIPPPTRSPADPEVSILAIGDSITSDRESYLKILNRYWQKDPSRKMLDSAVSGNTTSDLIKRFHSTVLNQEFQWAVLFIGTNDSLQLNDEIGISVLSLEEYKRNIRFITNTLLDRGKKLIQITIPPVDNARLQGFFTDGRFLYTEEHIARVNDFIREWAKKQGYPVADLAAAIAEQDEDMLEPDGLHLNGRAQRLICELLLDLMP
ncbi:MAG: SGNH/GDSL hydrolase family protein [Spirochaetaceae bacterium]|nr:MAG: SGNH/GDSL hydrolase family protein [Spirochaetaceae bacterium]